MRSISGDMERGNVMTPEYFPDATEMMRYMMMSLEDLEQEKQKLFSKGSL